MAGGETCDSILAGSGITIDTLVANNPNVNSECSNIYPGEVRIFFFGVPSPLIEHYYRSCAPRRHLSMLDVLLPLYIISSK
jgi:hypothetical protein